MPDMNKNQYSKKLVNRDITLSNIIWRNPVKASVIKAKR